jgi:hypothetical protein
VAAAAQPRGDRRTRLHSRNGAARRAAHGSGRTAPRHAACVSAASRLTSGRHAQLRRQRASLVHAVPRRAACSLQSCARQSLPRRLPRRSRPRRRAQQRPRPLRRRQRQCECGAGTPRSRRARTRRAIHVASRRRRVTTGMRQRAAAHTPRAAAATQLSRCACGGRHGRGNARRCCVSAAHTDPPRHARVSAAHDERWLSEIWNTAWGLFAAAPHAHATCSKATTRAESKERRVTRER